MKTDRCSREGHRQRRTFAIAGVFAATALCVTFDAADGGIGWSFLTTAGSVFVVLVHLWTAWSHQRGPTRPFLALDPVHARVETGVRGSRSGRFVG